MGQLLLQIYKKVIQHENYISLILERPPHKTKEALSFAEHSYLIQVEGITAECMDVDIAVPPSGVDHALAAAAIVPSDPLVEGQLGALDQPLANTLVHKHKGR